MHLHPVVVIIYRILMNRLIAWQSRAKAAVILSAHQIYVRVAMHYKIMAVAIIYRILMNGHIAWQSRAKAAVIQSTHQIYVRVAMHHKIMAVVIIYQIPMNGLIAWQNRVKAAVIQSTHQIYVRGVFLTNNGLVHKMSWDETFIEKVEILQPLYCKTIDTMLFKTSHNITR